MGFGGLAMLVASRAIGDFFGFTRDGAVQMLAIGFLTAFVLGKRTRAGIQPVTADYEAYFFASVGAIAVILLNYQTNNWPMYVLILPALLIAFMSVRGWRAFRLPNEEPKPFKVQPPGKG